jgi:hypothetical protein
MDMLLRRYGQSRVKSAKAWKSFDMEWNRYFSPTIVTRKSTKQQRWGNPAYAENRRQDGRPGFACGLTGLQLSPP